MVKHAVCYVATVLLYTYMNRYLRVCYVCMSDVIHMVFNT